MNKKKVIKLKNKIIILKLDKIKSFSLGYKKTTYKTEYMIFNKQKDFKKN